MTLLSLRYALLCGLASLLAAITVILGVGEIASAFWRAARALWRRRV